jgi:hypothetical protein
MVRGVIRVVYTCQEEERKKIDTIVEKSFNIVNKLSLIPGATGVEKRSCGFLLSGPRRLLVIRVVMVLKEQNKQINCKIIF